MAFFQGQEPGEVIFYLPEENEPSVFTGKEGVVNLSWIHYTKQRLQGVAVNRGKDNFSVLKEFFDTKVTIVDIGKVLKFKEEGGITKDTIPDEDRGHSNLYRFVLFGLELQEKLKQDLLLTPDQEIFPIPWSCLTSERCISLRWVLHVCREDGMSPTEAYAYAVSLMK